MGFPETLTWGHPGRCEVRAPPPPGCWVGGWSLGRVGSTSSPNIESLKQTLHPESDAPSASVGVTPVPSAPRTGLRQSNTHCGLEAFSTGWSPRGGQVSPPYCPEKASPAGTHVHRMEPSWRPGFSPILSRESQPCRDPCLALSHDLGKPVSPDHQPSQEQKSRHCFNNPLATCSPRHASPQAPLRCPRHFPIGGSNVPESLLILLQGGWAERPRLLQPSAWRRQSDCGGGGTPGSLQDPKLDTAWPWAWRASPAQTTSPRLLCDSNLTPIPPPPQHPGAGRRKSFVNPVQSWSPHCWSHPRPQLAHQ